MDLRQVKGRIKMPEKFDNQNSIIDEEILETAADMIHTEIEMDIMEHEKRDVCIPRGFNDEILELMREKDQDIKARKRKVKMKKITKIAAIFVICFVATGLVAIDRSDAFKQNLMSFIYDKGLVTVENDIEANIMNTWKGFWYPSYVPEDLTLKSSDERHHLLLYLSEESDRELRIDEFSLETSFTLDSGTTKVHDSKFDGKDSFYYEDETKGIHGIIIQDNDRYVAVECSGQWSQSEVMKIADGLVYIKNKNIDKK